MHALMTMVYKIVFFVASLVGLVVSDRKSANFVAIKSKSPGSEELCAVDVPTAVEWVSPHGSYVECGLNCINRNQCEAFNFNSELGKCDQYETMPSNFSAVPSCMGYYFGRKCEVLHRMTHAYKMKSVSQTVE